MELNSPIGVVAGNGIFPTQCVTSAKEQGLKVVVVAHHGETDPTIENLADACYWIKIGQLGRLIKRLKSQSVKQVVFAGGIKRVKAFSGLAFDLRAFGLIARLRSFGDDALLRGVAGELERDGITVLSPTVLVQNCIPKVGLLTKRDLTDKELQYAKVAWDAAAVIGSLDIGQSVVAYDGLIIAIEAIEGTDACIKRAGELVYSQKKLKPKSTEGPILVKRFKPQQDLRLDLPSIGEQTIEQMSKAGITGLVLEAEHGILLDPSALIEKANKYNIAIRVVNELS